jgi:hypothetical protein
MHHFEARVAQVSVAAQLLACSVGIGVLERAVRLGDSPLLTPEEVRPADRAVVSADPDLEFGAGQPDLVENNPRHGLERRL